MTTATPTRPRVRLSRTPAPQPSPEIDRHQQHRDWCESARTGDFHAAEQLAHAITPWCHDTARKCVASWGADTVEVEDVAAVGLAVLPKAIRTYNGSGTFTGWFFVIARRTMNEYCQHTAEKKNRQPRAADYELESCHIPTPAPQHEREQHLTDALCLLTPLERHIYCDLLGYRRIGCGSAARLAKRLKLTRNQVNRLYLRSHEIVTNYLRPRLDTL